MNIIVIFLLMTSSVMVINVSGYFMGPSMDQKLINDLQYSVFQQCQAEGVKIHEEMAANKSLAFFRPLRTMVEKDVSFLLYTWKNNKKPQILSTNLNSTLSSNFNASKETVLYVHPLFEGFNIGALYFTKSMNHQVLLPRKDINFIVTNWDSYSFVLDFMYSRNVTTTILGTIVGKFVQNLINIGADSKTIHLIGFSAGAQAIGLAGKTISPKVGRITAFDPQGNCFNFLPPDERISILDADYVNIVHCTVGSHAMPLNVTGNVTFYMNGGLLQPYCHSLMTIDLLAQCSHTLCGLYLYQSLEVNSPLKGFKCDSYEDYVAQTCNYTDTVTLTYDIPTNVSGLYFVNTTVP